MLLQCYIRVSQYYTTSSVWARLPAATDETNRFSLAADTIFELGHWPHGIQQLSS